MRPVPGALVFRYRISCHVSRAKPAPRPQDVPKIIQHPHPDHTHPAERPHQHHPVRHAQALVQGPRPQHAAERNHGLGEAVAAKQRGRELGVPEGDVHEYALEDQDRAARDEPDADGRHHEVDRQAGRPREYEEAGWDEEGCHQGWEKAVLGRNGLAGPEALVYDEVDVDRVGYPGDYYGDDDREEHEPDLTSVHAVDVAVDEWEELKEGVEHGVEESHIETCEQD